jgi:hypothetical protein
VSRKGPERRGEGLGAEEKMNEKINKRNKNGGTHFWRGGWRASRNGGWKGEFEGVCKMEVCLEALLELDFCIKPPNFGVVAHMEAPTEVALSLWSVLVGVLHPHLFWYLAVYSKTTSGNKLNYVDLNPKKLYFNDFKFCRVYYI